MAFTKLEEWQEVAIDNTEMNGIDLQENVMRPPAVNNEMREHMAQMAKWLGDDTLTSATTTDLGSVPGRYVSVTGTTTITGLGTIKAGTIKYVKFAGALTLTHNATSLILLGGASRTTAAGDMGAYVSEGSGNWREIAYNQAGVAPITSGSWTGQLTCGTSGTITMGNANGAWSKFGKHVTFTGYFDVTNISSPSGTLTLVSTGLPGTAANNNANFAATALNTFGQVGGSNILFQARVEKNTANIKIVHVDLSTGSEGANTAALVKIGTTFVVYGGYLTA